MADGKTGKTLNLTEGNPLKLILLFAIPVFLGRLFQMMYSLIDTKIVGSILGEEALAAVGSVSILYNLLTGIFSGFTLGFSIVTAQNYGSGNEKLLKKNVASSIMLGMMTAVVIIFAVLLFLNPILHAMNVPEEQFCMAHDYIRILVWGMFVTLAYNLCADMLRAIGDSVTPLIFLVIAAVTNIVLDYLFIGGFSMGVSGAACATVLSQLVSAVLCFLRIRSGFTILHISKNDLEWDRERMRLLYQNGLAMALMSSLVNCGTLILQTGINKLGTNIIVAHTAARKVFEIFSLPVSVFGASMATYCGQNYVLLNQKVLWHNRQPLPSLPRLLLFCPDPSAHQSSLNFSYEEHEGHLSPFAARRLPPPAKRSANWAYRSNLTRRSWSTGSRLHRWTMLSGSSASTAGTRTPARSRPRPSCRVCCGRTTRSTRIICRRSSGLAS